MDVNSVSGGSSVTAAQLQSMDIETALMTVQADRANNLEKSIKDQMETVRQRNANIAGMNQLMATLRGLRSSSGTDPQKWVLLGKNQAEGRAMHDKIVAAGLTMPTGGDTVDESREDNYIFDARQKTIDVWIEELKGKADAESSSQQMDMLRLQSLTNKRNEAFELMTNFIKKISDSKSGVISNLR